MSDEPQRIPLSKKGQRKVTPFTGNELLFDYLSDALDEERKQAVASHLENSKEAQMDLQKIRHGMLYAERMKNIAVSDALVERLRAPSSYLSVLFQKARFDQWPVGLKWGLEALAVVFVIVTVLSLAPWEKVLKLRLTGTNEVVLTELNKTTIATAIDGAIPKNLDTPEFDDEDLKPSSPVGTVAGSVAITAPGAKPNAGASPTTTAKATPTPKPAPTAKPAVVAAKEAGAGLVAAVNSDGTEAGDSEEDSGIDESGASAATTASTSTSTAAASAAAVKASGGFLYRGTLAVTNLEAVGPKIAEKITQIGGRKAGEVELGWMKNEGSAYFHFTVPEAKYDELKEFLAGYGKPVLSLEKHPRVMPDGIVRLIITVDEAKK